MIIAIISTMLQVSILLSRYHTYESLQRCLNWKSMRLLSSSSSHSISRCLATSTNRPTSNDLSLDTTLIATQTDLVVSHLESRKSDSKLIEKVLTIKDLRAERNNCIVEGDRYKSVRKTLSKEIGSLMAQKKLVEVEVLKQKVEQASQDSALTDDKLAKIDVEIDDILSIVPNLLDDRVPDGVDDKDNVVVFSWGSEKRRLGSDLLWHDEIARRLNGLDVDAAVRISGARFSVLVGPIAKLERALIQYFLDCHTSRGYTEVSVPFIVSRSTLEGTGQLPKFEDDLFKVNHAVGGEDAFLIPTAEVPVTNLFRDQILNGTDLPVYLVCSSPSFRAEAGSYGRDTRGLLRQHQFHKVELVKICTPESSSEEHEKLVADAEHILQSLELPYRKMLLCSGDTGFSARMCYDLEVWLPGQQEYREISSCSNCHDFQSRRMSLRYRPVVAAAVDSDKSALSKKKSTVYPHTLNGSGLAVGRTLVAVLENYQQPDGSVVVPTVLRPYMGGAERLEVPRTTTEHRMYSRQNS